MFRSVLYLISYLLTPKLTKVSQSPLQKRSEVRIWKWTGVESFRHSQAQRHTCLGSMFLDVGTVPQVP